MKDKDDAEGDDMSINQAYGIEQHYIIRPRALREREMEIAEHTYECPDQDNLP